MRLITFLVAVFFTTSSFSFVKNAKAGDYWKYHSYSGDGQYYDENIVVLVDSVVFDSTVSDTTFLRIQRSSDQANCEYELSVYDSNVMIKRDADISYDTLIHHKNYSFLNASSFENICSTEFDYKVNHDKTELINDVEFDLYIDIAIKEELGIMQTYYQCLAMFGCPYGVVLVSAKLDGMENLVEFDDGMSLLSKQLENRISINGDFIEVYDDFVLVSVYSLDGSFIYEDQNEIIDLSNLNIPVILKVNNTSFIYRGHLD